MTEDRELVGLADIAVMSGLGEASVRTYHTNAQRRRRLGEPQASDLPAPDVVIGRTPAWKRETVQRWIAERDEAAERNIARLRLPRGPRKLSPESSSVD